jgi:hypothetical protein
MSKQVAKTESKAVSTSDAMAFGAFGTENVINQDLTFPKILLMQGLSQWVSQGLAAPGEIVESFEKRKLGNAKKPVQIIPFFNLNVWKLKKEVNGKFVTVGYEDRVGAEARMDREFTHSSGEKGLREKTFNLFCLLKDGNLKVPYMVGFTNYSFKHAAQSYLNKLQLLKAEGKSPAYVLWNLGVTQEKNAKGEFPVFTLDTVKDEKGHDIENSYDEVKAAFEAHKSLSGAISEGAKVDMSGDDEAPQAEAKQNNF